jgi:hypothetical protein
MNARRNTAIATALVALLAFASPAAALGDSSPVRLWSISRIDQGAGAVQVAHRGQVGDKLRQTADVGRVVFNLPLHAPYWYFLPRDRAFGALDSSADGGRYSVLAQSPTPNPIRVGAPKGTITHLDE